MKQMVLIVRTLLLSALVLSLGGCKPNVYGSVGVSGWGGSGPRIHGNVSVGGRICC